MFMKGSLAFILFITFFSILFPASFSTQVHAQSNDPKNIDEIRRRHLELMQRIQKQFDADQKDMDQFFNNQLFKQADQMFKQLSDGKDPFAQIIEQFGREFESTQSPSQWIEQKEGMAFVLPYTLGPKDKIDIKIKEKDVHIEIKRWQENGLTRSQSYQFPIPKATDPSGMEILNKDSKTLILFPWAKKTEKIQPKAGDKRI